MTAALTLWRCRYCGGECREGWMTCDDCYEHQLDEYEDDEEEAPS